ncbi:threonine aldolase family protein [Niveispirillum sp. KHB5.9]|uniref:threonine aldolase family protein n=1 Tax=Niveispirillum sp. KHB5.9 TaxID=3400269 RepID=UPI003A892A00
MNFMSDNVTGAAPEILAALIAANDGTAPSYGADDWTRRLTDRLSTLFERDVAVFPVATGTAANALALAALTPPWGSIYCHAEAHIQMDECGAPENFTGGAKLVPLAGDHGKIAPDTLSSALDKVHKGFVHAVQPASLSLTQATEAGTIYTPDEVSALTAIARHHGMRTHMDGARFANAVASLGCAPADITWRAGVDVLSFGATKNGALGAEAVVFFDRELSENFGYRRKRAAHLFSKMRFLSAQLDAYLDDGLWLRLAGHANRMATRLAEGLTDLPGAALAHPVDANELFVALPEPVIAGLEAAGFGFYRWDGNIVRLVTAWNSEEASVDALLETARGLAGV